MEKRRLRMLGALTACFGCARPEATRQRKDVTFLVLGLENAGKSTVCACLQNASTEGITPTIGFANGSARLKGCNVTLLDLGGGERLRGIWHNYYAETHGLVFVIDASDVAKIDEAKKVLVQVIGDRRIKGKPLLIFANKQDGSNVLNNQDLSDRLGLKQLIDEADIDQCQVVSCTALRSAHPKGRVDRDIRRGAKWLLRCVTDRWEDLSEQVVAEKAAQRETEAAERRERVERVSRIREERAATAAEDGSPKEDPPVKLEPSSSTTADDVQQSNCDPPPTTLEIKHLSIPVIVITSASTLNHSISGSTSTPEMDAKDSSQSCQQELPQNSTVCPAFAGETSVDTPVAKPMEDDLVGTLQECSAAPPEDTSEAVQVAAVTSLSSQVVSSHISSFAATSSTDSSTMQPDSVDLDPQKCCKKKILTRGLNKVHPVEQVG